MTGKSYSNDEIYPEYVSTYYYSEKYSVQRIADLFNVPHSRINKIMKDNNFMRRSFPDATKLTNSHNRKGTTHTDEAKKKISMARKGVGVGVRMKYSDDRLILVFTMGTYKDKGVHIYIAEKHFNRKLKPKECVHHIDGNSMNNHPENLSILTNSEHARIHREQDKHLKKRNNKGQFMKGKLNVS